MVSHHVENQIVAKFHQLLPVETEELLVIQVEFFVQINQESLVEVVLAQKLNAVKVTVIQVVSKAKNVPKNGAVVVKDALSGLQTKKITFLQSVFTTIIQISQFSLVMLTANVKYVMEMV